MPETICSSILQLGQNIFRVGRMTDRVLEVVERRGNCNVSDPIEMNSDLVRFWVTDLLEGYQFELTDYKSFWRLTFRLFQGLLNVDVEIGADVLNLADIITRHAKKQERIRTLTETTGKATQKMELTTYPL
jgi:hypothetical protein